MRLVTMKPIYILYVVGFSCGLAKIDFEKITSKDFLPLLPPKKKQKIMDVGVPFNNHNNQMIWP